MKVTAYDIANVMKTVVAKKQRRRSTQDQSIIDRLIQEELLSFTSLDDMVDPLDRGSMPLTPDDMQGSQPLIGGSFENPAEWFSDDDDVSGALEGHAPPTANPDTNPGWREAGLGDGPDELASLLEGDTGKHPLPATPIEPPAQRAQPPALPKKPAPEEAAADEAAAPKASTESRPEPAKKPAPQKSEAQGKSGGGVKWLVAAVVLLAGAGAALAWFTGLIPH